MAVWLGMLTGSPTASGQRNDKRTGSKSPYVHVIDLLDVHGRKIDPLAENAAPFSPEKTCIKCHDVPTIRHGWHFSSGLPAADGEGWDGRRGEPWIWSDPRSGTAIPVTSRRWEGAYAPEDVGLTAFEFATRFGAFTPGGGVAGTEVDEVRADEHDGDRFEASGALGIDCLICHAPGRAFRHEVYAEQIAAGNLSFASSAALGLAKVSGKVESLPKDFDLAAEGARDKLPKVTWNPSRFEADGKAFVDILREPQDAACYRCHTTRETAPPGLIAEEVGSRSSIPSRMDPRWSHDDDVHLSAGIGCVDCHPNGMDHRTVRGFEGEPHPANDIARSFSCRGCHLSDEDGGRFGSPKPAHKGLPPIHLETMSCTSCHSGPAPSADGVGVQTSMAHAFAIGSQTRTDRDPPAIVAPVFLRDDAGVITPHRMIWPAFFGYELGGEVRPLDPDAAYAALKKAKVRIRSDFRTEIAKVKFGKKERARAIGEEAAAKADADLSQSELAALTALEKTLAEEAVSENLKKALAYLAELEPDAGSPLYVSSGKAYRLADDGTLTVFDSPAAQPYRWPLAHRVRPARQSLGARGCTECHAADAPFFYGDVTAAGPLPDPAPIQVDQREWMELDTSLLSTWEMSFRGRNAFKWVGITCVSLVGLAILAMIVATFSGLFAGPRRSAG